MNAPAPVVFTIPDLQTGCDLIARLSLADPQQAEIDLIRFLDSLLNAPPDGQTYFKVLEQARVAIAFCAEELSKTYLAKPLPLGAADDAVFQSVVALWLKTARAYAHCSEKDPFAQDPLRRKRRVAMILHRCIHHTGMAIVEHQRARRELPWGLWLDLHGYYASAEEWGIATLAIPDPLEPLGRATHCSASYISFLLGDMAGRYSLSLREQTLVRRWAVYWAPLASLHKVEAAQPLPAYVVDLMQDMALRPVGECLQTEVIRRFDTTRLALQISQTRAQLRQRIAPARLALGDDCSSGQCRRLLEQLSHPWSQVRAARKFRRRANSGIAKVCTGFEEMHYFISGKEFEQPENIRTYSRREYESLYAFRHQCEPLQVLRVRQQQLAYGVDVWEVVDQSANGFRLMRSTSGKKMSHGQLLALCPHDGEHYLLGQARWLMQEKGGGLISGIHALPGMPVAVAARPLDRSGVDDGKYHRAFVLPAVPSVDAEQSIVLPRGWFRGGRSIELFSDLAWTVRLSRVLDDGPDYERVSFTLG